ncbi:MAG: thymidylate kinase, partial [Oscillospiraceae bacterium]|nr:thymidylate kinase [Oscillospiraceae bacterium]
IHEEGDGYLERCAGAAREAAEYYGWRRVNCTNNGKMRPEMDIHLEILGIIKTAGLIEAPQF